jgi:hypothetical protein
MLGPMARRFAVFVVVLACLATSNGCSSGTETGNPSFQAEMAYTAYSSAPLVVGVRDPKASVIVDSAWLDLGSVSLLGSGTCSDSDPNRLQVPALGIGEHAAGNHNLVRFEWAAG